MRNAKQRFLLHLVLTEWIMGIKYIPISYFLAQLIFLLWSCLALMKDFNLSLLFTVETVRVRTQVERDGCEMEWRRWTACFDWGRTSKGLSYVFVLLADLSLLAFGQSIKACSKFMVRRMFRFLRQTCDHFYLNFCASRDCQNAFRRVLTLVVYEINLPALKSFELTLGKAHLKES